MSEGLFSITPKRRKLLQSLRVSSNISAMELKKRHKSLRNIGWVEEALLSYGPKLLVPKEEFYAVRDAWKDEAKLAKGRIAVTDAYIEGIKGEIARTGVNVTKLYRMYEDRLLGLKIDVLGGILRGEIETACPNQLKRLEDVYASFLSKENKPKRIEIAEEYREELRGHMQRTKIGARKFGRIYPSWPKSFTENTINTIAMRKVQKAFPEILDFIIEGYRALPSDA
jgi:hypothetical protein